MNPEPIRAADKVRVTRYPPGKQASPTEFQPGDFILTHVAGLTSMLTRFGQSLRYWGPDRKYVGWTHAALIVTNDGEIIEALGGGVVENHISHYRETEYHLVSLDNSLADSRDREQAVAFARHSLRESYGWLTILSIGLNLATGCKFSFGVDGQTICSELVARCLERTSIILEDTPQHISPAALAKAFRVEPGPDKGTPPRPLRRRIR